MDVAHPAHGPALDRRQTAGNRDDGIPEGPLHRVGHCPELDQSVRQGQDVCGYRAAFLAVGVQQSGWRVAGGHQGQLPGQVVGIHDPGVHALPAGRAVDVHSVAGQHDPAAPVGVGGAPLAPEGGQPGGIGHRHRLRCPLSDELLDLLQRRRPPVPVTGIGEDHPPEVLAHRHADQRPAVGPEERVDLVVGTVPVQVDVGEQPVLRVRMPLEVQAELAADTAVRAIGADHVISGDSPHGAPGLAYRGGGATGVLGADLPAPRPAPPHPAGPRAPVTCPAQGCSRRTRCPGWPHSRRQI